jgi:hypothetical protein
LWTSPNWIVATIQDVFDLEYTDDHRPKRRGESKAIKWAATAREAATFAETFLPLIQSRLTEFKEAGEVLQRTAASGSSEDVFRDCRVFHDAVRDISRLASEITKPMGWEMKTAMEEYVRSLAVLGRRVDGVPTANEPRAGGMRGMTYLFRTTLRNVTHLELAFNGIESAERVCAPMLSATDLQSGNIQNLRIHTAATTSDPFNVIRCFWRICTNTANIVIADGRDYRTGHVQSSFLRHIRQ